MPSYRPSTSLQRVAIPVMGAAIIAVGCAGTADAYWKGVGTGSSTVSTGTVSLTATVSPVAGLYPGGSVPVTVTVKNTSTAASMKLSSLAQTGAATIHTAGKASCDPSVVSFSAGTLPTAAIAPNATASAPGSVNMTTAAADGCQGATFAIPLIANGRTS